MPSHKVRRRVIEKERRIKQLRAAGKTCAEIATELGVSTQRIYDFLNESRNRRPVLSAADRLHRDEDVRRKLATKKLCVPGKQKQFANVAIEELEEILLAFEFSTLSIDHEITQVQITKPLRKPTPRPGVDAAITKLRYAIADAKRATLLRYREYTPDRSKIKWQVWSFFFSKSK